jgi:putative transposase
MRAKAQTYMLTAVAWQRRSVFQKTTTAELFIATLFRYRDAAKYQLHGFVVMPDHVHILLTPALDMSIERCAQLIKGGFSFAVRKDFTGEVWQAGYYAHRITDTEEFRNQSAYISNNPLRKRMFEHPHVHTAETYREKLDVCIAWDECPGG